MRTRVRIVAAAALILAVLSAGCTRVTGGTVAMTTEPGPPTTTQSPTTTPRAPTLPRIPGLPRPDPAAPEVPAPPNALTMTCDEYIGLDEPTQWAVVRAILGESENPLGPLGPEGETISKTIADAMCQFMPDATVNEVLLGGG